MVWNVLPYSLPSVYGIGGVSLEVVLHLVYFYYLVRLRPKALITCLALNLALSNMDFNQVPSIQFTLPLKPSIKSPDYLAEEWVSWWLEGGGYIGQVESRRPPKGGPWNITYLELRGFSISKTLGLSGHRAESWPVKGVILAPIFPSRSWMMVIGSCTWWELFTPTQLYIAQGNSHTGHIAGVAWETFLEHFERNLSLCISDQFYLESDKVI